jgi:hypothetical protein
MEDVDEWLDYAAQSLSQVPGGMQVISAIKSFIADSKVRVGRYWVHRKYMVEPTLLVLCVTLVPRRLSQQILRTSLPSNKRSLSRPRCVAPGVHVATVCWCMAKYGPGHADHCSSCCGGGDRDRVCSSRPRYRKWLASPLTSVTRQRNY